MLGGTINRSALVCRGGKRSTVRFRSCTGLLFSAGRVPRGLRSGSSTFCHELLVLSVGQMMGDNRGSLRLGRGMRTRSNCTVRVTVVTLGGLCRRKGFARDRRDGRYMERMRQSSSDVYTFVSRSLIYTGKGHLGQDRIFRVCRRCYGRGNERKRNGSGFFEGVASGNFLLGRCGNRFCCRSVTIGRRSFCPITPRREVPFRRASASCGRLRLGVGRKVGNV